MYKTSKIIVILTIKLLFYLKKSNKCTISFAFYLLRAGTGAAYFFRLRLPIFPLERLRLLFFFLKRLRLQEAKTCGSGSPALIIILQCCIHITYTHPYKPSIHVQTHSKIKIQIYAFIRHLYNSKRRIASLH